MKPILSILLFIAIVFYACGPTLESSNEDWTRNTEAVDKLKQDYPAFTPLIDKKLEQAKQVWEESQEISDEEKKLDKMVEANNILDKGSIGNLRNMKSKISSLKSKKESLMKLKTPDFKLEMRAKDAFNAVDKSVKQANSVLVMTSSEFDIESAPAKIDLAFAALNDAYKEVDIIIGKINAENKDKADEKAKVEKKLDEDNKKAEEAKKDIKCSFCGTFNKSDYIKCSGCGAGRTK